MSFVIRHTREFYLGNIATLRRMRGLYDDYLHSWGDAQTEAAGAAIDSFWGSIRGEGSGEYMTAGQEQDLLSCATIGEQYETLSRLITGAAIRAMMDGYSIPGDLLKG